MTQSEGNGRQLIGIIILVLLLGAFLRWAHLSDMQAMLNTDEAANGLDALSLIESPRLTPFFSSYTGRESGWHYWLTPFLLVVGIRPIALRLAATMAGIMTIAAVYMLGREIFPKRAALWSSAGLAVLYWHIQLSLVGFRAILFLLVGTLAMGLLWRARRTNVLLDWLGAGVMLGLLAYTYFSARMWLGYAGVMLLVWIIREHRMRRGAFLAGGTAVILALPLLFFTSLNPTSSNRIEEVSVLTVTGMVDNSLAWLGAWFHLGDQNVMLNLPGRPVLDWVWAIPFLVGAVCLFWVVRERQQFVWIIGLAFVSIVPSLFSDHAPHFLRAIGLIIPVTLAVGAGLFFLEKMLGKYVGEAQLILPVIWLVVASVTVSQTIETQWLNHPDLYDQMEVPLNQASDFIDAATSSETPVYFTPISRANPTLLFQTEALSPRHVAAFDYNECWVKTAVPTLYVLLDEDAAKNQTLLSATEMEFLQQKNAPAESEYSGFTILSAKLREERQSINTPAIFGEIVQLRAANPLPHQFYAGDMLSLDLDFSALQPIGTDYKLFVHVYGTPSPYEGGEIWAQTDIPICISYPMRFWQPFEIIQQQINLDLPPHIPPGAYTVVTGLYDPGNNARLPLTEAPQLNQWDHYEIFQIEVVESGE